MKTKISFEEWLTSANLVGNPLSYLAGWNAALANLAPQEQATDEEIIEEIRHLTIARNEGIKIDWEHIDSGTIHKTEYIDVYGYDDHGCQAINLGRIPRPIPKKRPMTREELNGAINDWLEDTDLQEICRVAGISTEVDE